jgi:hypothetical protein
MRKDVFCAVIVGFLLLASPVLAEIQAELETPDIGQEVSGKSLISGWAYSTLDPNAAITVTLRINGTDTSDTIPCCTPRLDVQTANPGAPLNTGFGRLQNYGIFNPATLSSIGVRIAIQGEPQPRIIDHQVIVVKPGTRSSDVDPTLFSFLQQLSASGARAALDGEELIVAPVTVTDSGAGGTRKSTLRLLWKSNTQTFGITAAASGTSFDGVQAIFNNSCATAQCHDHTSAAGTLDLSEGRAFRRTVAVRSDLDPEERFRVNPGKASESYLYQKIIAGGSNIAGTIMPPSCAPDHPSACLSDLEVQTIVAWINEGAPPPQQ